MLLKDEVEKGESRRLEFKENFSPQHHGIAKTAISFEDNYISSLAIFKVIKSIKTRNSINL